MSIASFLTKIRKQKAIYWAKTGDDGFGGTTFAAPADVDCRWSDVSEKYVDDTGVERVSVSSVIVDQTMITGGYLKLDELDSATPDSPIGVVGASPIRKFMIVPDIKNTVNYMKAIL